MTDNAPSREELLRQISGLEARIAELERREGDIEGADSGAPDPGLFRALVEQASEAIVVLDTQAELLAAFNPAAIQLLGRSAEELARCYPPNLSPEFQPDGRPSLEASRDNIQRALAGERPVFEWVHLRGDGTEVFCEIHLTRLPHPQRSLVRGAIFDIGDRLETEESLRKSEARYRAVVEDQSELIVRWLPDGTRTFVNQAYARYFRRTPGEIAGTSIYEGLPEEDLRWIQNLIKGLSPEEPVRTSDRRFRRRHGPDSWVEWTTRAFFDSSRRPVEYQSVGRDITEAKEAQERLRLTQFSVDQSQDSVLWADAEGRILYANDTTCHRLGFSREELLEMNIPDIDPEPGAESWPGFLAQMREKGHLRFDSTQLKKDGTTLPVEVTASLLSHDGTEYVVGVARDLSERQELESKLRQSQKMEAIGQLTGGIAHDFNNLMSVVLLHAEILARAPELNTPLLRSAIKGIENAAEKAAGTTRKLLGFSRQATLEMVPVDLGEEAMEVASILERVLPENIKLRVKAASSLPAVRADRTAVQQILLNLANNARDAMPEGGELEINIQAETAGEAFRARHPWIPSRELVRVSVSDSGHGMPEAVRERAFEPFFTTKAVGEGTGLGLAMVYGLARQHGGAVETESEPGKGSRFHIFFPSIPTPIAEPDPARKKGGEKAGTETILLAEDEEMLRAVGKAVLEEYGYRVLVAEDGQEALDLFLEKGKSIDLIISDVVMPNLGGIELYHAIQESDTPVRFLLASGYPGRQAPAGVELNPEVPFIKKPWRMGTLLEKVREVLDQPLG